MRTAEVDVARWWDDHPVRDHASVAKQIDHPEAGDLRFDIEIVGAPDEPDHCLVIYTAEPDSPTARMLPMPACWLGREVAGRISMMGGQAVSGCRIVAP